MSEAKDWRPTALLSKSISTSKRVPSYGPELGPARAAFDAHRLDDADVAAVHVERLDAGLVDRVDEGRGAAIHDRHFAAVDLDQQIVDAEAEQRGHDMLDGRDVVTGRIAKHRAERRTADLRHQGRKARPEEPSPV